MYECRLVHGLPVLSWACVQDRPVELQFLLHTFTGELDIRQKDFAGLTALHYACQSGNANLVYTHAPRRNDGVISSANFVMMLGKLITFGPVRFSGSCILILDDAIFSSREMTLEIFRRCSRQPRDHTLFACKQIGIS
jgi:hypothetical protein